MDVDNYQGTAEEVLRQVGQEVAVCKKCILHHSRKRAVPGEGPGNARIMFIGEGPGFHENEQGRPFVGAAGKFLDELLASIKMHRSEVFITNVVKCRPPGNRDPQLEELEACGNYLERQIQAINPAVIVTLGRYSMARFLPHARISDIHGQAKIINGRTIVAMYHPAAALHQNKLRSTIEADFKRLPDLVSSALERQKIQSSSQEKLPEVPEQVQLGLNIPEESSEFNSKKEPKQLSLF